jgi:hypothetical protein
MNDLQSHVQYEIDMVRETYARLPELTTRVAKHNGVDQVVINAFVESFWLHVSCLAKHVGIWDLNGHPIWRQIEDQILTIGPQRSNVMTEKLGDFDMSVAVSLLRHAGLDLV